LLRVFSRRRMRAFGPLGCALGFFLAASLAVPFRAGAAGFEMAPLGARDGGRGGASVAGADSAFGLFYNPATLLSAPGFADGAVAVHGHVGELCFQRNTVQEAGDGTRSVGERLPRICSDGGGAFLPQAATSLRFGNRQRFAVGLGVSSPLPRARTFNFGGPSSAAPAPSRYLLVQEDLLQLFPTLGAAYAPHRQIRLGASFGWGITRFDFTQFNFSRVVALPPDAAGATSDISVRTDGTDPFTPRFQVGALVQPAASLPLWLAFNFQHTQDVRVDDARVRIQSLGTAYYASSELIASVLRSAPPPVIAATVRDVHVRIPQTSTLTAGARYAAPLARPADEVGDRLSTERFDVELDVAYTFSSRVEAMRATLPATTITVPSPAPLFVQNIRLDLPTEQTLPQRWKDQVGVRLGGDLNVLPGRLSMRAGVQYESSGIRSGYEQLLYAPTRAFGLSCGATVRVLKQLDASLAYTHYFLQTRQVSPAAAQLRVQTSGQPRESDAVLVNAGTFSQSLDALALELTTRF
jgi:hypothetical protein